MAYCVKCGAKVDESVKFCPQCGAEIPHAEQNTAKAAGSAQENYTSTENSTQDYTYYQAEPSGQQTYEQAGDSAIYFDPLDVKKNKSMGVLSYIGILVLIPLLAGDKKSPYLKQHINQGLMLFVISSIINLLDGDWVWGFHSWINLGGSGLSWILDIAGFACFILWIMGIVSACKGTKKELPIVGKIRVLK